MLIEAIEGMGGAATDLIASMQASLPVSMSLNPTVVAQTNAIITAASSPAAGFPTVIATSVDLLQCPKISETYFEIKAPICCDIVVAFYW